VVVHQVEAPEHLTVDKGHGRVETRRIWTSDTLNGYVAFPYVVQVACVEQEIFHIRQATTTLERVSLLSSLSRTEASPAQVLALNRGHWGDREPPAPYP